MILPRGVGKGRFDPRPGRPVPASLRVCAAPPEVAVSPESVPSSSAAEPGLWLVPYSLASTAPQQLQRTQVQQYLLAPARTYGIISDPAWVSERLNVTARVRVRAYRVGESHSDGSAPAPPSPPIWGCGKPSGSRGTGVLASREDFIGRRWLLQSSWLSARGRWPLLSSPRCKPPAQARTLTSSFPGGSRRGPEWVCSSRPGRTPSGPEVELWAWLAIVPGLSPAQLCGREGENSALAPASQRRT